jgi:hypothetical protein
VIFSPAVAVRVCVVSYVDHRQIRHAAEVQDRKPVRGRGVAIKLFREDPWLEKIGPSTVLDVEVREPGTKHAISLQQVERWLAGATTNPNEASKKAKLKVLLMKR